MSNSQLDISKLAESGGTESKKTEPNEQPESSKNQMLVPVNNTGQTVIQNTDLAWIEATQSLQRNLVRSLQDYKATWRERRALTAQRERMISEVTDQYVTYLRKEAELASNAALDARDSVLRQELARLKAQLYTELADITGATVVEIERIAQSHHDKMASPAIQQEYNKFIMRKILNLLEQSSS